MSIKQGDYLKRLRIERGLSQESLSEVLGISRQSISKWEQGNSAPDIDNIKKLSDYFNVSVDSIVNGEPDKFIVEQEPQVKKEAPAEKVEQPQNNEKKKHGWLFPAYPVLMVILYCIIGSLFSPKGWYMGWLVLLTIPLYYTGVIAVEKKKPVIFCYPVLALLIFLLFGLVGNLWHPAWIIFLTIPVFYIIATRKKNN
jgi:transcriptional regulator with XRE-family HTH domain